MKFLLRIIITAVVAFALSSVLRGIHIDSFLTAIVFSVMLAILNMLVKPLLIILTFPITILTFGLFLLVINAGLVMLAGAFSGGGFYVANFKWALLFSLLLTILTSLLYGRDRQEDERGRH